MLRKKRTEDSTGMFLGKQQTERSKKKETI